MTTTITTGGLPRVAASARPVASPTWPATLAGFLAYTSLVVVTALWLANRGAQELFAGTGPALTSTGRLAGLLAADLLLLQVLGMARIPWVERIVGQDRLARWHRWAGFTSFNLMLGHIVLVTLGYALTTHRWVLSELWTLVATYPGMLLATAGALLLVLVVITSIRAARRRLRYESWHLLHLYAYLGVGLALPHQLWNGGEFVSSPAARTYWWSLYGLTLIAVVSYRLGLPAWRTLRHRLVVANVVTEAPGVVSLHLSGRALARLPARAGQFFIWRFLDGPGWSRGHPYSLSAPPNPHLLRLTVKDLGDGSRSLAGVTPGTRVLFEGPYGALTSGRRTRTRVTLLAAGIGITPLRALFEELPCEPGDTTLVIRARGEAEIVFRAELETLAAARGARLLYLLGPRARPESWLPVSMGHLSDSIALRQLVPDIAEHDVFLCGPDAWMDAVTRAARDAGVAAAHIHTERFTW